MTIFLLFCLFCFDSVTSDVQAITATVVGESTIDIQCLFVERSNAVGCKVVFVSECTGVDYHQYTYLSRVNTTSSGQLRLNLSYGNPCHHRVFAYDIEIDNTTSNLAIEGIINNIIKQLIENTEPST